MHDRKKNLLFSKVIFSFREIHLLYKSILLLLAIVPLGEKISNIPIMYVTTKALVGIELGMRGSHVRQSNHSAMKLLARY